MANAPSLHGHTHIRPAVAHGAHGCGSRYLPGRHAAGSAGRARPRADPATGEARRPGAWASDPATGEGWRAGSHLGAAGGPTGGHHRRRLWSASTEVDPHPPAAWLPEPSRLASAEIPRRVADLMGH